MTTRISYEEWIGMGKFLELEDGKIFYVKRGEGFPVFLMHFYGGESWWVSPVVDAFAEHFSVYAIDIPGCGQSDEPPLPYGPPQYADALIEFMNRLGIDKAHLVGIHGSGFNSVHLATTRPHRVGRLVLDGYPPWTPSEGKRLFREVVGPTWMDENEWMRPYEEWDGIGDPFPSLQGPERDAAVRRVSDGFVKHRRWIAGAVKEALNYDGFTRLPLVQSAALVLYGESDWGMKPVGNGEPPVLRLLGGIPGARAEIIPNAGLVPSFEQPERYCEVVLDFLLKGRR